MTLSSVERSFRWSFVSYKKDTLAVEHQFQSFHLLGKSVSSTENSNVTSLPVRILLWRLQSRFDMTTTAITAVLAIIRQRSSLFDPPRPLDAIKDDSYTSEIGAINVTDLEAVPKQVRDKSKSLSEAGEGPALSKPSFSRPKNKNDSLQEHIHAHRYSSFAMSTRLESLEDRCDWHDRALHELGRDIGLGNSSSSYRHPGEPCSVTNTMDATLDLNRHKTTASKNQKEEPKASDNPMTKHFSMRESPKNPSSTKRRRGYASRDLDKLSISGTSKLDLHQDIANTHRKLSGSNKWRNRWSSSGRRWSRRAVTGER